MPSTSGLTERRAERSGAAYRPHLDGLRAVAVYLVVVFHAGADRLGGGFIGVDVFFVLSGYLVTQLLLRDVVRQGSIEYGRFYARRFRRLLPAAAVVIVVTVVVYGVIASPAERLAATDAVRAASLYVSNWYFIDQSNDYFGTDVQNSPVLHFWSLSVEEQFYLAWPLLLGGVHLVTRRAGANQRRVICAIVGVALLASLVAAIWISRTDLNRAYYGTDTRAYQLLAGSFLALAPGIARRIERSTRSGVRDAVPIVAWGAIGALAFAATSWVDVGPITRGVIATAATVALILSLESGTSGVRRLLSLSPIVYLGRISYGTYLWHWIVILVMAATVEVSAAATAAFAALVATALASLSYQLLEMPVRESRSLDRRRGGVIAVGLASSALVGLVVGPRLLEMDRESSRRPGGEVVSGVAPIPASLDWESAAADSGAYPTCNRNKLASCTLTEHGELKVMLIGDSNAKMYVSMFEDLSERRSFTFQAAVSPGCYWMVGIQRVDPRYDESCQMRQAEWYGTIVPALDPDIVVVVNRTIDDATSPIPVRDQDLGLIEPGTPKYRRAIERRIRSTVEQLRADDRKVVIIEPMPVTKPRVDPLVCLSEAVYLDDCRFITSLTPTVTEVIDRAVAETDAEVWSLDLDRLVCPYLPICDPVVDGLIVRTDHAHLTQRFARSLVPAVERALDDDGILPA